MASACMGDIAILEVALRNHMDRQLSLISLEQSGTEDWYMAGLRFDDRTQRQIREAWGHLTIQQKKRCHSAISIRIVMVLFPAIHTFSNICFHFSRI